MVADGSSQGDFWTDLREIWIRLFFDSEKLEKLHGGRAKHQNDGFLDKDYLRDR